MAVVNGILRGPERIIHLDGMWGLGFSEFFKKWGAFIQRGALGCHTLMPSGDLAEYFWKLLLVAGRRARMTVALAATLSRQWP
jgi:hypothetical protein